MVVTRRSVMANQGRKQPKFMETTSPQAEIKRLDKRLAEMAAESMEKSEKIKKLTSALGAASLVINNLNETVAARDERIAHLNMRVMEVAIPTPDADNRDYYKVTLDLLKTAMRTEGIKSATVDQLFVVGAMTFKLVMSAEFNLDGKEAEWRKERADSGSKGESSD